VQAHQKFARYAVSVAELIGPFLAHIPATDPAGPGAHLGQILD